MFGLLKRKPLSPELQKVYDQTYKAELAAQKRVQFQAQMERVKLAAKRNAIDAATPASAKFMKGLQQTRAALNKIDNKRIEAFVCGPEKAKK